MDEFYKDLTLVSIPSIVIAISIATLTIIAMWKIYEKANEAGWKSLIPIYNLYILFKITWGNGLCFLLLLIPIVNAVIVLITFVKLSKVFGQGIGFALGLIFLNTIFILVLGLGYSSYQGIED